MKKARIFIVLFLILALTTQPVYAYIDPGTGSMIIQAVVAAVLGAGVFIRIYWNKIKGFFTKNNGSKDKDE